jgi:phosphoglucosamine mutase
MEKLFGTDGIRGVANKYPITVDVITKIGKALAYLFKRDDGKPLFVIGKDTRISCSMLENALSAGICSMGGNVYLMGIIPTPGVAFMTRKQKAHAGIVISASHNPFEDNGIKIFSNDGYKLSPETEKQIEDLIIDKKNSFFVNNLPRPEDLGEAFRKPDSLNSYAKFLKNCFPKELNVKGMKIVLDCSNGATYRVAPKVFRELGATVYSIHNRPDGMNINLRCGSQYTADLADMVVKKGAHIGMAFDGDGDRMIAVDEKGNILSGNQILLLCAHTLKKEGKLRNNTVVTTVMSNIGLDIALREMGINHIKSDVGDRNVLRDMVTHGSSVGGEDSGHLIFLDYHTSGDGIISGLQLLSAMAKEEKPLSEMSEIIAIYPQTLINVDVKNKPDISSLPEVTQAIADVEKALGPKGRVLVRHSGTQQICRVMIEGPTQETTDSYCKMIADVVKRTIG